MPIIASLIARGTVVLAEHSPNSTNFSSIVRRLIEQIPSTPDSKKSYSYESYNFHYLVEGGITYICMTDQNLGYRIPYAFLFDLNNRFKGTYGQKVNTANQMAMNESFGRVLQERMEFFSNDKSADKIAKVKGDIDDVKKTMVTNIEKALLRNEQIEVLVDKTDDLNTQSQSFKQKGTKLKKKMWWKNLKLTCCLITVCVVIFLVVIFLLLAYFGVFKFLPDIFHTGGDTTATTWLPATHYSTSSSISPTTLPPTSSASWTTSMTTKGTTSHSLSTNTEGIS